MTKFRLKPIGILTKALAAIWFLSLTPALPADAQSATPQRGGSAIFSLAQDPTSLSPVISSSSTDKEIGCIVYQGLVENDDDYNTLPLLAKSWTVSSNGLTYTFELNHAKWHDGTAFTSADVKYSLLDIDAKYSSLFIGVAKFIDDIDASVPDKVIIKLKSPFAPFLLSLGCTQGAAIMPAHIFAGTDPRTNPASTSIPVGTGAFKLAEWHRGDYIRLVRNPDYYEPGRPYLDEVIGKIIPQSNTRIQALSAGEIDYIRLIGINDLKAVELNPGLRRVPSDTAPVLSLMFFNGSRKPLDDKRVRQALTMATDRDYILKSAFFDIGKVGTMPFTSELAWAANPNVDYRQMYPFDVARANALLDEAGATRKQDGTRFALKLLLSATKYPEFQQVALALKSMWRNVGVDIEITTLEDTTFSKRFYIDGDYDLALDVYSVYSDPAIGIARTYISSMIGRSAGNAERYNNPQIDDLFAKGERTIDKAERAKYYQQIQAILADDLPVLTLRENANLSAASIRLQGLWGVQGIPHWSTAWLTP